MIECLPTKFGSISKVRAIWEVLIKIRESGASAGSSYKVFRNLENGQSYRSRVQAVLHGFSDAEAPLRVSGGLWLKAAGEIPEPAEAVATAHSSPCWRLDRSTSGKLISPVDLCESCRCCLHFD